MADPRNSTNRKGTNPSVKTFKYDGSIVFDSAQPGGSAQANRAVQLTGQGTAGLTVDASEVIGQLLSVEDDGFCAVQVGGVVTLAGGTAAALTPGSQIVGALLGGVGGYIRNAAAATLAEVAVARGVILDATDPAQVEVDLG